MCDDPLQRTEGLRQLDGAERIIAPLLTEDPKNIRFLYNAAHLERRIGIALADSGRDAEAAKHLERAAAALAPLGDGPFGPNARLNLAITNARLATLVSPERGLVLARATESQMSNLPAQIQSAWMQAPIYRDLGIAYRRAGRPDQAAAGLEKGRAMLDTLKPPPSLEPKRLALLASIQAELVSARRP
jgi:tetratricopeptide (TPR) repeat protein